MRTQELTNMLVTRRKQGCCYDCGRRYGDEFGFPDLIIPDDIWLKIAPLNTEGGFLCPSCMCRRLWLAGIKTKGIFTSGPFCETVNKTL